MNRRAFIKLVGVIAGSLVLPVVPGGLVNSIAGSAAVVCNCSRCAARRSLGEWVKEKIGDDLIAALSGLQEAA